MTFEPDTTAYNTAGLKKQILNLRELVVLVNRTLSNSVWAELHLRDAIAELELLANDSTEPAEAVAEGPRQRRCDLLTITEVAVEFGMSRTTLYKLRRSEAFPKPIRISERKLRFRRSDIDQWLSEGGGKDLA